MRLTILEGALGRGGLVAPEDSVRFQIHIRGARTRTDGRVDDIGEICRRPVTR